MVTFLASGCTISPLTGRSRSSSSTTAAASASSVVVIGRCAGGVTISLTKRRHAETSATSTPSRPTIAAAALRCEPGLSSRVEGPTRLSRARRYRPPSARRSSARRPGRILDRSSSTTSAPSGFKRLCKICLNDSLRAVPVPVRATSAGGIPCKLKIDCSKAVTEKSEAESGGSGPRRCGVTSAGNHKRPGPDMLSADGADDLVHHVGRERVGQVVAPAVSWRESLCCCVKFNSPAVACFEEARNALAVCERHRHR